MGNELRPTQTIQRPTVTWKAEKGAFYTLIKGEISPIFVTFHLLEYSFNKLYQFEVDPDAPSRKNPDFREIRHWLVMNIPESDVAKGDEVIEYIGSGAPKGTGLHRYIFLIFKQPNGKIDHNEPRATKK